MTSAITAITNNLRTIEGRIASNAQKIASPPVYDAVIGGQQVKVSNNDDILNSLLALQYDSTQYKINAKILRSTSQQLGSFINLIA